MQSILDLDATELAAKIKQGEYTSYDVVSTYVTHLEKANKHINCLTFDRFDLAKQEAREADLAIQSGQVVGRLHGVPISIKDCFHVAGMATTSGLPHRKDWIEEQDAEAVALLKQEGAIIIGKTNTPALCFCQETDNKLHGKTNNPWDLSRTSGGSSGGEGALIAVGGAAVGLGADIGGSIRFPSHSNGIVGFKSGKSQVSAVGNFPHVAIEEQDRMLGVGAMAKSVRDARLMNEVLSGHKRSFVDLDAYTLVVPEREFHIPLNEITAKTLDELRQALAVDFQVESDKPPYFDPTTVMWQEIMSINGGKQVMKLMSEDSNRNPITEFVWEKLTGKSEVHSYLSWALIGARLFKPSDKRLTEIRGLLQKGDEELKQYFAKRILILPVYYEPAQKHGKLYGEIFSMTKSYKKYMPYVAYANVWGLPALTIPITRDEQNMPIGIQLISVNGNEDALFQLAEYLEETVHKYTRCTTYD